MTITYGDSVYRPSEPEFAKGAPIIAGGPAGRWVRVEDPEYENAFKEQLDLENSWIDAREEAGDG